VSVVVDDVLSGAVDALRHPAGTGLAVRLIRARVLKLRVRVTGRPVGVDEVEGVRNVMGGEADEPVGDALKRGDVARVLQLGEAQVQGLPGRTLLETADLPDARVLPVVIPALPVGVAGHDVGEEHERPGAVKARRSGLAGRPARGRRRDQFQARRRCEALEHLDDRDRVRQHRVA
jgi:hypothetical protein